MIRVNHKDHGLYFSHSTSLSECQGNTLCIFGMGYGQAVQISKGEVNDEYEIFECVDPILHDGIIGKECWTCLL